MTQAGDEALGRPAGDLTGAPGGDPDGHLARLMGAAQDGDAGAYAELLRATAQIIRRIMVARRGFVDGADVEDLVQEVLFSVHSARSTFDPSRPFLPWLMAITRHRLADAARRHSRITAREVSRDDPEVTFAEPAANPDLNLGSGAGDAADPETLHRAIANLPAGQRQAITLLKLRELSLKEAAEESGMSIGALKVATHRAMLTLRRVLGGGEL